MEKKKIIVTGAGGQLGRELQVLAAGLPHSSTTAFAQAPTTAASLASPAVLSQFDFVFADRNTLSIEDQAQVNAFFKDHRPTLCINCAAYTAVDKAESDQAAAFRINSQAPGYLAAACRDTGAGLIHISTDYVFDGNSATPLKEDDPTSPINVYGASKWEGEKQALQQHPEGTLIIRTSWVYSEFGNNFVKTMIRLMTDKPAISVVNDQIGSPTYAADLAAALLHIASAPKYVPGIYNYSNEGQISWYEFALAIRKLINSSCNVSPIASANYPTPARRPHYSLLDKTRIKKTYGLTIPDWQASLTTCIARLRS